MGLVYVLAYQHADAKVLDPVLEVLAEDGHNIMTGFPTSWHSFLSSHGSKVLLLVADGLNYEHAEGMMATKQARWNGVKSVAIQHGFYLNQDEYIPTSDIYCLWGDYWLPFFRIQNEYRITGNPVFDVIPKYPKSRSLSISASYGENSSLAMLTPQMNAYIHFGMPTDIGEIYRSYINLVKQAEDETGFNGTWLVRPHPSDLKYPHKMKWVSRLAEEINGVVQRPDDGIPLYDILSQVEIVAGFSTVVFEGFLFGAKAYPIYMKNWLENTFDYLGSMIGSQPNDGMAAERVAAVVEEAMT